MKRKKIIWWTITVALFCLAVTMFIILVFRARERGILGEIEFAISEEKPATTRNNATVSVVPNAANQTNISVGFGNLTDPKVYVQQWREDLMSIEDTLHCIDRYMEKIK